MKISANSFRDKIEAKISPVYALVNKRSGGVLDISREAIQSFNKAHGAEGAASVGYFVFFSLIPLLLLLVSIAGFLLVDVDAIDQMLDFITQEIPIPRDLIENNLRQLLQARNIGGAIGLIGLLWAASGSFISLTRNINSAWSDANYINVLQGRLFALAIIASIVLLMILWYLTTIIIGFITQLDIPIIGELNIQESVFVRLTSGAYPWIVVFLAVFILYKWVPNTKVRWIEAFWGAVIAFAALFIATRAFTWFISSGVVNYQLIYGSLGTILAFLTWVYITAWIVIFGAHISAAIASVRRKQKPVSSAS